jgi:GTPase SAR1 family protein
LQEVRQFAGDNIPFVLIGNKLDLIKELGEVVDRASARDFAEQQGSIYIETSALDGTAVDDAFMELTRRIVATRSG